ncbi:DUF3363 domain-containing protein (plasmid) [Dyella sp. BiH032]|uniref:DUF3363 domain-containing protein n=1 Tax=Dyella sp. BiH032 TaxID=3075430 RepID=UPI002892BF36|nr:DUF3363 domain-containing protein [Dyella sp. BiH032]WNL48573.1 DUF3363 domain-containing protein [Dyella sp. BiH032]
MKPTKKGGPGAFQSGGAAGGEGGAEEMLNIRLARGRAVQRLTAGKQLLRRVMNTLKQNGLRSGGVRAGRAVAGRAAGVQSAAGKFGQRVFVRVKPAQLSGNTAKRKMAKHLDYIQRDGVGKETDQAQAFGPNGHMSREQVSEFGERCLDDRHQFRMQVSPEFGGEMDLERHVSDLMGQMEKDLGTPLDWVAVCHYNTDNPHAHVVIRGKDDADADLVLSRDYIKQGIRSRASDLATNELGYRTSHDLIRSQAREIGQEKFTSLDRAMLQRQGRNPAGELDLRRARGEFGVKRQTLEIARVQRLKELGLATEVGPGRWKLSPETEERLRLMNRSREMGMVLGPHLQEEHTERSNVVSKDQLEKPITGRVLDRGYSDEFSGREYLVLAGHDGAVHYVNLPFNAERTGQEAVVGDTVQIAKRETSRFGTADKNIQAVAQAHGGTYSRENHVAYLKATNTDQKLAEKFARIGDDVTLESYVEAHVNRATRHASHKLVAEQAGAYSIPADFEKKVTEHTAKLEAARGRDQDLPARIGVVMRGDPKVVAQSVGYTHLDRDLQDGKLAEFRAQTAPSRTQAAYLEALEARTDRLITLGLAERKNDGSVAVAGDLPKKLSELELKGAADNLALSHGRYVPLDEVRKFKGEISGYVNLPSGPQALIKSADTFTLVPADSRMLAAQGKHVEVSLMRGKSVTDWTPERQRQRIAMVEMDRLDKGKDLGFSK